MGRDEDVPRPLQARPRLPQGRDTALSAVTKWRRGRVLSGSRPSSFGSSVLCACTFVLWLSVARDFGFCRLCPRAPASGPEVFSPTTSATSLDFSDLAASGRPFSGFGPSDPSAGSAAVAIASPVPQPPTLSVPERCRSSSCPLPAPGWETLQAPGRAVDIWKVWTEQGTLGPGA